MPNQSKQFGSFEEDSDGNRKRDVPAESRAQPPKQEKAATTGWFGGIWSKLALRPKNQMKLPDDKNPSVSQTVPDLNSPGIVASKFTDLGNN